MRPSTPRTEIGKFELLTRCFRRLLGHMEALGANHELRVICGITGMRDARSSTHGPCCNAL